MTTSGYVLRRLGASVLLLLLLTLLTFTLYRAIPANPAGFLVDLSPGHVPPPAVIAKAEKALGVDKPLWEQYGLYLWRAVHGDLGIAYQGSTLVPLTSERTGQAVGPAVVHAAMVTGSLVIGGALFALLLSVPLGAIAASRPRSLTDRTILVVSLIGICTHPLVVALLLQQFPGQAVGDRAAQRLLLVLRHGAGRNRPPHAQARDELRRPDRAGPRTSSCRGSRSRSSSSPSTRGSCACG